MEKTALNIIWLFLSSVILIFLIMYAVDMKTQNRANNIFQYAYEHKPFVCEYNNNYVVIKNYEYSQGSKFITTKDGFAFNILNQCTKI